jgi:hypothetical protein
VTAARSLGDPVQPADLARAALTAARTILEALQLDDTSTAQLGAPLVDVRVVQLAGRQRQVLTGSRDPREVTVTGRQRDVDVGSRRRTFTWSGRPRPPSTGSNG